MSRKNRRRGSLIWTGFLALIFVAVGGAGWLIWTAMRPASAVDHEILRLKNEFPHVVYTPPQADRKHPKAKPVSSFKVVLQKTRPPLWTSEREVSHAAKWAIIVSEDWAFYQHDGFDAAQIQEALKKDIGEGRMARGASTITQQVVKNIFLSQERSLIRKAREFSLAIQLDRAFSKSKILELYLNIAEWGEGIFGIRAASRFYFGKEPSELTAREGAFLAMLLPSPKRYSQSFRDGQLTPFVRRMIRSILGKLLQAKILTPEEYDAARIEHFAFEKSFAPLSPDEVRDDLGPEPAPNEGKDEDESAEENTLRKNPTEVDQNASVE